ncbi:MAG: hypothetical protein FJX31_00670 [Alphaproteobacteria bacterium]|nr:hypothetical protein [Alphaproteobacteria bacterium]
MTVLHDKAMAYASAIGYAASKQIGTAARQMDEELDKGAEEAGSKDEAGSPPHDGPEPPR